MSYAHKITEGNYLQYAERVFHKVAKKVASDLPKQERTTGDLAEAALTHYVDIFSHYFGDDMAEFEDTVFADKAQAVADAYYVFATMLDANPVANPKEMASHFITQLVLTQFESFESWGEPIFDYFFADDCSMDEEMSDDDE